MVVNFPSPTYCRAQPYTFRQLSSQPCGRTAQLCFVWPGNRPSVAHRVQSRAGLRRGGPVQTARRETEEVALHFRKRRARGRADGPSHRVARVPALRRRRRRRGGVQGCRLRMPRRTGSWGIVASTVFYVRPLSIVCNFPLEVSYSRMRNVRPPCVSLCPELS